MNRKELRAIANYQNQKEPLPSAPLTVRIGNRDIHTGHYEVILPNGAVLKNGVKLFKASLPYGTEVEGKLSPNGQLFYLDYVDAPLPEETTEVEEVLEDEPKKLVVLILCIDITKSIETSGITKSLEFLNIFLIDYPSAQVGYVVFGDDWCAIFEPTNPEDLIAELNQQIANYTGEYSTGFWGSEGTDLPENGIDAIAKSLDVLTSFKSADKYLYLVTDNEKYSRNVNNASDVLSLINVNNSIKRLVINFINPVNETSEHIVEQGTEENPYCVGSAITQVLINDEVIENYPASSNILIENRLKLRWDGGGEGKEYIINNPNDYEYEVWIRGTQLRPRWVKNIAFEGWALDTRIGHRRYFPATDYYWRYYEDGSNSIVSETEGYLITLPEDFFPNPTEKGLNVSTGGTYTSYPSPPTGWINNGLQPESAFDYETSNFKLCWIALRDGETINQWFAYPVDRTSVELINFKVLRVNSEDIQDLEETDIVKAVCQPQVVPIENIENGEYVNIFTPSKKIIYL